MERTSLDGIGGTTRVGQSHEACGREPKKAGILPKPAKGQNAQRSEAFRPCFFRSCIYSEPILVGDCQSVQDAISG